EHAPRARHDSGAWQGACFRSHHRFPSAAARRAHRAALALTGPSMGELAADRRRHRAAAFGPLSFALILLLAPLFLSEFRLGLLGKFLALALVALGHDLIWGYGGMLSLGQGLFFGLGAYAMAMYLKLESSAGGLPDFMSWSGLEALPALWEPFRYAAF